MGNAFIEYEGFKYMVSNKDAAIGDKVLIRKIIDDDGDDNDKHLTGKIFSVVDDRYSNLIEVDGKFGDGSEMILYPEEYVVLEPIEESPDLSDLVIRLSQTVARQQSEIDTLKADLQSFAETATEADYKAGQALTTSADLSDKVDMITDDVVMLDERSQPLVDDSKDGLATEIANAFITQIRERL